MNYSRKSALVLTLSLLVNSPRAIRANPEKKELLVLGFPIQYWISILGYTSIPCVIVITSITIGVSYKARTLTTYLDITFIYSFSLEGQIQAIIQLDYPYRQGDLLVQQVSKHVIEQLNESPYTSYSIVNTNTDQQLNELQNSQDIYTNLL